MIKLITKILASLILAFIFNSIVFADPVSTDTLTRPISAFNSFRVEPSLGMASYAIPIDLPPGRRDLQPKLALEYSSSNPNTWLGVGWNLNLGFIERSIKKGVPEYGASDKFRISFNEFQSEISINDDGVYWPDYCPRYLKLAFENNSWKAYDKEGTTYYFGQTDESRINSEQGTFRWMLNRIMDSCGNYINISYKKVENQAYPYKIEYTGNEITKDPPTNAVEFILEDREDFAPSYQSGFSITTNKRLKQINTKAGAQLAKTYVLGYKYSDITSRSLLSTVTTYGSDGITALPAQKFFYQEEKPSYKFHVNLNSLARGNIEWNTKSARINTDLFNDARGFLYPNGHFSDIKNGYIWWGCGGIVGEGKWICFSKYNITTVDSKGNINFDYEPKTAYCLSTYLYCKEAKTITMPVKGSGVITYFLNGDYEHPYDFSAPLNLKKGYNLLEITSYNLKDRHTFNLNFEVMDNVDSMNSFEAIVPQVSADFNGDGKSDLGAFQYEDSHWQIELSTGDNFLPKQDWGHVGLESLPGLVTFVCDFDGDGKTDVGYFSKHASPGNYWWNISKSSGNGFYDTGSLFFIPGAGEQALPLIGEFNGDGKSEIGYYREDSGDWYVAVDIWKPVLFLSGFGGTGWTMHIGDFNGDGLTDVAISDKNGNIKVAFCDGNKFIDQGIWTTNFGGDKNLTAADFNGDGLCDIGYVDKTQGKVIFRASTGRGFKETDQVWISGLSTLEDDLSLQLGDFNGDGLIDPFVFNHLSGHSELGYSKGKIPDLLSRIENGIGASMALTYSPSTLFDNKLPVINYEGFPIDIHGEGLPMVIPIVTKLEISDGLGNVYKSLYNYKGGYYNISRREFQGFSFVSTTDNDNFITDAYYHQKIDGGYSQYPKMKPFRIEKRDSAGKIVERIENTWNHISLGGEFVYSEKFGFFTYLFTQEKYDYTDKGEFKKTLSQYVYDTYSNYDNLVATKTEDDSGYSFKKYISYNCNVIPKGRTLIRPFLDTYYNDGMDKPNKWLFYDNNTDYNSLPTKGLLTKEVLAGDYTYNINSANNPVTTYSYDSFGNLISTTDARKNTTTKIYDSDTYTYPETIINSLGKQTKTTYDLSTGQPLTFTDSNNQTTKYIYDTLGRLTKVIGPKDSEKYPGEIYEYDYSSCPIKITKKIKLNNSPRSFDYPDYDITYSFFDGLNRPIQTKSPAKNESITGRSRQIVSNTIVYSQGGQVREKYLPYFVEENSEYSPIDTTKNKVILTYDCLGRLLRKDNPDGTNSTNSYSGFTTTYIDENGHQARTTQNSRGKVIKKDEFNGTLTYTTTYKYDSLGDLIEIKDDKGNITTIEYDPLRRKVSIDDPDIGKWYYIYDTNGNLKTRKDARGKIISFDYDALNRLVRKTYAGGELATYYYDDSAKSYCNGRLSYAQDPTGRTDYYYDALGRKIKETKAIDGNIYTIEWMYDPQGRVISIKYPDEETVNYALNKLGAVEKITGASNYISNLDYSASKQINKIEYGNGVYTEYAYDPATLRLTNIQANNGNLENLHYQYDSVGNIKSIVDKRNTASQELIYDDLNRLVQANGAYGNLSYQYDPIGNILFREGINYTYGQADNSSIQPHALTSGNNGFLATYDANGNMVYRKNGYDEEVLTYDAENRLIKWAPPSNTLTLSYNFNSGNVRGWHFISFPALPANTSILSVTNSGHSRDMWPIYINQASKYNSTTKKFEHFVDDRRFDKFSSFEPLNGYLIHLDGAYTFTFTGTRPKSTTNLQLRSGYNLVGNPFNNEAAVEAVLAPLKLGIDYSLVQRYNSETMAFEEYSAAKKDFTNIKPLESVYIYCLKDIKWSPYPALSPHTVEFAYDASGNRVKKVADGITTIYIDGLFEKTGSLTTKHIYLGENKICSIINDNTKNKRKITQRQQAVTPEIRFFHSDHLGSTNLITDSKGNQIQLSEYNPFGEFSKNSANLTSYYFTGKELDSTRLYYYGARYYDPMLGRFISPDPIDYSDEGIKGAGGKDLKTFLNNPQNLNRYTYCLNNPITNLDPDGLLTIFIPGTFSNYIFPTYDYMNTATQSFNDKYGFASLTWSGGDSFMAHANASLSLAKFINSYNFAQDERLNIVGLSHGGNIGLMASRFIWNHKIDNLVLLGTPIRGYKFNRNIIGKIYNVYSNYDFVQKELGGGQFYLPSTPFTPELEFGPAGNTLEGAINLNISVNEGIFGTHKSILDIHTWNNYVDPLLKNEN